ncbi:MAG: UDP-glucose/GDP-mannose dehydrogenase family protein [Candidatus Thermoplasmatota archaeon]|nr:UDP-glucose/GDP-mannose dehydrogenase family protein [Candidatus Thermoplasmatota archaeon]
MKISIIGTGYVGLVSGVGFAKHGHEVICVDIDEDIVDSINNAIPPIYEEGLEELLEKVVDSGKLSATTDLQGAVEKTDITFICVGTPSREDGSIDTSAIESATEDVSEAIDEKNDYHIVVVKSTVTPGTTDGLIKSILESSGKKVGEDFGLGMNPEFLREGVALDDFLDPDRIVIGGWDEKSRETIKRVYESFDAPKLVTDIRTAEMIKYTSNALLATKISFANEMSRICEEVGIDVYDVMDGVGLDHRIKRDFLNAGPGFGGSCFPKDVKAIKNLAKKNDIKAELLEAVLFINSQQPIHTVEILEKKLGDLKGKNVTVLGLTFKGGTDDIRETRALPIVESLLEKGAKVTGYDPKGMDNFSEVIPSINYADSIEEALKDAEACIIQNDWDDFSKLEGKDFEVMKNKVVLDGRRVLDEEKLDKEIKYLSIGKGGLD